MTCSQTALHSTMVLFKLPWCEHRHRRLRLYIPLWFYSNASTSHRVPSRIYFTFHYGSIQMSSPVNTTSPTLFPLHSTMVLFKYKSTVNQRRVCNPLHSTMVLFKYTVKAKVRIQNETLHSTMVLFKFNTHLLTLHFKGFFTFHYGSIQIYSQNFDR